MPLNRPTTAELLQAVQGYLAAPVEDPRADRFYRRVAANVLGIVERQWQAESDYGRREEGVLRGLLGQCGQIFPEDTTLEGLNAALCEQLEHGLSDALLLSALPHLKALAVQKLAIDHPGYDR